MTVEKADNAGLLNVLRSYCAESDGLYTLSKVWKEGDHLYATDGRRCARIRWCGPWDQDTGNGFEAPPVMDLRWEDRAGDPLVDVRMPAEDWYDRTDCRVCRGTGESDQIHCDCGAVHALECAQRCIECDGRGFSGQYACALVVPASPGGERRWFQARFLRPLIGSSAQFRHDGSTKPLYARTPEGLEALVMPVNVDASWDAKHQERLVHVYSSRSAVAVEIVKAGGAE